MQDFQEIQINQNGIKWKSKKEVYDLLTNEGGNYQTSLIDANNKYISQTFVGDKKAMKWRDIIVCSVPHLEGLTIPEILHLQEINLKLMNIFKLQIQQASKQGLGFKHYKYSMSCRVQTIYWQKDFRDC